ncbi:hypothetical protein ARAM_003923 [Aspergillus rambellii]|uniref:Zn(2)-C6 fungal-type domain-containing protein n=1 Tax=Aspergillus rambellii TaxID=308745 RepID=A0A0F8XIY4_9EURO|nr:hypothetical protein ARAM_003923 [Aspergillus rambellii]
MDDTDKEARRRARQGPKRRRPPLACTVCYRRKLKCGRELPACSRCVKSGQADACTYRNTQVPLQPGVVKSAEQLRHREAGTHSGPLRALEQTRAQRPTATRGEMTHFKGADTLTKFYGFSYHLNFYQQAWSPWMTKFPELRPFIVQVKDKNPAINRLRDEIYSRANRRDYSPSLTRDGQELETLRQLLPPRGVADLLVQNYIDRFEVTHRVIHIPTFLAEYNQLWDPQWIESSAFLVQLILVLAAAASLRSEPFVDGPESEPLHDLTMRWVGAAETWLSFSPSRVPDSLPAMTIHTLLLIAKRANDIQESESWIWSGALIRRAMAAGYHRELSLTARISPFHREMRRRLWTTILELDLQIAVERGMPPTVRSGDFNIDPTWHIDDEEIQESMTETPPVKALSAFSSTTFQSILSRSLNTRLQICAFVNGSQENEDHDSVLQLNQKLHEALQEIPTWDSITATAKEHQAMAYSIRCMAIIDHYCQIVDDNILPEWACRNGLVLAALNICHEIYISSNSSDRSGTLFAIPGVAEPFMSLVERTLKMLEQRVVIKMKDLNEYYTLAMVIGLVKSKIWPQNSSAWSKEAADRIINVSCLLQSSRAMLRIGEIRGQSTGEPLNAFELGGIQDFLVPDGFFSTMAPEGLNFLDSDIGLGLFEP